MCNSAAIALTRAWTAGVPQHVHGYGTMGTGRGGYLGSGYLGSGTVLGTVPGTVFSLN